jgi:hypothetical protein
MTSFLFLCTLLVATPFAAAHTQVYTVELQPFGDTSQVTGKAVVFTADGGTVAYSGSAALLEKIGTDFTCTEVNGKYSKVKKNESRVLTLTHNVCIAS